MLENCEIARRILDVEKITIWSLLMKLFLIPNLLYENTQNLIPEKAKEALLNTQFYLVENERTARRFIGSLKLGMEIRSLNFHVLDKKTSAKELQQYFNQIPKGSNVGIISEAGVPCVADPGSLAVDFAHKQGWEVVPISGPSSILLALMGSGFNGQLFTFHGYLPIKAPDAIKKIRQIESAARKGHTQIFMETPFRNNKLFEMLLQNCGKDVKLCVASNLTSPDQYLKTKVIGRWKTSDVNLHKKPTIFLLGT